MHRMFVITVVYARKPLCQHNEDTESAVHFSGILNNMFCMVYRMPFFLDGADIPYNIFMVTLHVSSCNIPHR